MAILKAIPRMKVGHVTVTSGKAGALDNSNSMKTKAKTVTFDNLQ